MQSSRVGQIGVPAAIIAVVVMMVVPLPTVLLDMLLAANIAGAVLILLVALYVHRPLDFAVFPSLLLIATLTRLALNVSVTRQVLLHGYAGHVIESFGHFVVGGSLVVGLIIFVILIVIQFAVVTNGAGRVAEVAARFTLDAMPGKQMAIDADLNAGLIDEDTARRRRQDVAAEADFYGAMDGASKFVKGDAIAAIVIVMVNLFGGFIVGVVQHHQPLQGAIATYSLLSVGDGLASQIPALLISISTGLIVTRAATERDMGSDLVHQFGRQRRALQVGGGAVVIMGLVPGLPKLPFLLVGGGLLVVAARLPDPDSEAAAEAPEAPEQPGPDAPETLARDMRVEPLELELAFDLVDLVDPASGGDLLDRVRALRRKLALELGVVIPLVRTRDNVDLPARSYAIKLHGVVTATGEAPAGTVLAIGDGLEGLPGTPTREPVFGLDAKWVPAELRAQAELLGATVVDRSSVITTHLAELVRTHSAQLLGREDVKVLLDMVRQSNPAVVEDLTSGNLTLADVQRCLQGLLAERVPIRDLARIFEAMTQRARVAADAESLVEAARATLGPAVSAQHAVDGRLPVLTLDPLLEQTLVEALRQGEGGSFLAIEPPMAQMLVTQAASVAEQAEQRGDLPALVCAQQLRPALARLLRAPCPHLPVLSYAELGEQLRLDTIGVVDVSHAPAA